MLTAQKDDAAKQIAAQNTFAEIAEMRCHVYIYYMYISAKVTHKNAN